jgi:ABC-type polysaccharide/polyol phosphate export permease
VSISLDVIAHSFYWVIIYNVMTLYSTLRSGLEEIRLGITSHEQWLYMAVQDIKLWYRRSMIGPWWVTISTGIMVMMLGFLWSQS